VRTLHFSGTFTTAAVSGTATVAALAFLDIAHRIVGNRSLSGTFDTVAKGTSITIVLSITETFVAVADPVTGITVARSGAVCTVTGGCIYGNSSEAFTGNDEEGEDDAG
jgi:hypothetical protein